MNGGKPADVIPQIRHGNGVFQRNLAKLHQANPALGPLLAQGFIQEEKDERVRGVVRGEQAQFRVPDLEVDALLLEIRLDRGHHLLGREAMSADIDRHSGQGIGLPRRVKRPVLQLRRHRVPIRGEELPMHVPFRVKWCGSSARPRPPVPVRTPKPGCPDTHPLSPKLPANCCNAPPRWFRNRTWSAQQTSPRRLPPGPGT